MLTFLLTATLVAAAPWARASQVTMDAKIRDDSDLSQVSLSLSHCLSIHLSSIRARSIASAFRSNPPAEAGDVTRTRCERPWIVPFRRNDSVERASRTIVRTCRSLGECVPRPRPRPRFPRPHVSLPPRTGNFNAARTARGSHDDCATCRAASRGARNNRLAAIANGSGFSSTMIRPFPPSPLPRRGFAGCCSSSLGFVLSTLLPFPSDRFFLARSSRRDFRQINVGSRVSFGTRRATSARATH